MLKKYYYRLLISTLVGLSVIGSGISIVGCGKSKAPEIDTWSQFEAKALKVSATDLAHSITNISNFSWKTTDIAVFSSGGAPQQKGQLEEINATIVILDQPSYQNYPINLDIKYEHINYNISNWKASQSADIVNWEQFTAAAFKVSPADLLKQAKLSSGWNSFKWIGDDGAHGQPVQNKWTAAETANFDTFGSTGASDPYKGMAGQVRAININRKIEAIISIKGKDGNYDANPIKASLKYDSQKPTYNIDNWTFSQAEQYQSKLKYIQLADADNQVIYDKGWRSFTSTNWSNPTIRYQNNILQWFVSHAKHKTVANKSIKFTHAASGKYYPDTEKKDKTGFVCKLIFNFAYQITNDPTGEVFSGEYNLSTTFTYANKSNPTYGTAFNYSWSPWIHND